MSSSLAGTARYVRINTTTSPSWVAWREVEIYATLRIDETAVDSFYLGLLNRAADQPGYVYYLGQIRTARCANPNSVHGTLDAITSGFINSPEFAARNLSNEAYVAALYIAILRRDADAAGLQYHKNLLDTNAATREQIRQGFISSVEFAGQTVAPIMSESCTTV